MEILRVVLRNIELVFIMINKLDFLVYRFSELEKNVRNVYIELKGLKVRVN